MVDGDPSKYQTLTNQKCNGSGCAVHLGQMQEKTKVVCSDGVSHLDLRSYPESVDF